MYTSLIAFLFIFALFGVERGLGMSLWKYLEKPAVNMFYLIFFLYQFLFNMPKNCGIPSDYSPLSYS